MAECKEGWARHTHTHTSLSSSLDHSEFNGVLREEAMGSAAHEKSWSGLSKACVGGVEAWRRGVTSFP